MAHPERRIWGVRTGTAGDANTVFLGNKHVAIGWAKCRDLGKLPPDREAYKRRVANSYSDTRPSTVARIAGQLYRFVHEMKRNDLVVYPSRQDPAIHIGCITGEYKYDPDLDPVCPNLRPVEWLGTVDRIHFTQEALREMNTPKDLFEVKKCRREVLAASVALAVGFGSVGKTATVQAMMKEFRKAVGKRSITVRIDPSAVRSLWHSEEPTCGTWEHLRRIAEAQAEARGPFVLFLDELDSLGASEVYVAAKSSPLFHRSTCPLAARISAKRLTRYSTRDKAIQAGKKPCPKCKP